MSDFEQPWPITDDDWNAFNGRVESDPDYRALFKTYEEHNPALKGNVETITMTYAAILCAIKLVHAWIPAANAKDNYFWVLVAMVLSACGCLAWNYVKWVAAAVALKAIATGDRVRGKTEPRVTLTKTFFSKGPALPAGCASKALEQVQLYKNSLAKASKKSKLSSLEKESAQELLQGLLTNDLEALLRLVPSDVKLTDHHKYLQKKLSQQQQQSAQPSEAAAGRQTRSQSLAHAGKAVTLAESLRKDAELMGDLQVAKQLLRLTSLQLVCTARSQAGKLVDQHTALLEKLFPNNSGFRRRQVAEARQLGGMLLELHSCTFNRELLVDAHRRDVLYDLSSLTGVPYRLPGESQDADEETETGDMQKNRQPSQVTKLLAVLNLSPRLDTQSQPPSPQESPLQTPSGSPSNQTVTAPNRQLGALAELELLRPMEAIAELYYHSLSAKLCPDVMIAPTEFCFNEVKTKKQELLCLSISTPYAGLNWVEAKLKLLRLAQAAGLSEEQLQHMLAFAAVCWFRTMAILLGKLHSQWFLHNDVKPENIVLLGSEAAEDCTSLLHLIEDPSRSRFVDAGAMLSAVPLDTHQYVYNLKTTGGTRCFQSPELNNPAASVSNLDPRMAQQQTDTWSMAMAGMRLSFLTSEPADAPLERRAEILHYCSTRQQHQGGVDVIVLKNQWFWLLGRERSSHVLELLNLFRLCTDENPASRLTPQMLLETRGKDMDGIVGQTRMAVYSLFYGQRCK